LDSEIRPRLRPGTPGGKEEAHPQTGARAYDWCVEETDDVTNKEGLPVSKHGSMNEGELV
jgi:hypothetical protein